MKKLALLFFVFSLRAIDVAQETRLLAEHDQKSSMLYQATQAAEAKSQHSDRPNLINEQPAPVMFDKSCCGVKGLDPIQCGSFLCLTVSFCLQCLQG
jgi:hypothetical protein